jgi:hypothetical protein
VPGVFRTIDPPPPLHPASVSSPPRTQGGERVHTTHFSGGEGVGSIFRKTPDIGLASYVQYNLSTQPKRRKTPRPVPAKQVATVAPSTTVIAPVDTLITPATDKKNSEVKRRFHIKTTIIFWGCILSASLGSLCCITKKNYYCGRPPQWLPMPLLASLVHHHLFILYSK